MSGTAVDDWTRERWGLTVQCHLCGGNRIPTGKFYEFGLGKNITWTRFFAFLALMLGGEYVRLRLALCDRCAKEKRVWGWWLSEFATVTQVDCQQHPWWDTFHDQGYRQFIGAVPMRGFPGEDIPRHT